MKAQMFNRSERKVEKPTKAEKIYTAMQRAKRREAARKKEAAA